MNDTVVIAIVSAGSAIIGGVIPSVFSYLSKRQDVKNQRLIENHKIKRDVYYAFIEAMQNLSNGYDIDRFDKFQISVNKLHLYADNETAKLVNTYYLTMAKLESTNGSLTTTAHFKYQTDIINAMRKDIGIDSSKLDLIPIISTNQ